MGVDEGVEVEDESSAKEEREVVDLDRAEAAWKASTDIVGELLPLSLDPCGPRLLTLSAGRRGGDIAIASVGEERGREGDDAA